MKLGIVGASGLVGQNFLKILNESQIPIKELRLFSRSEGKSFSFQSKTLKAQVLKEGSFKGLDLCFFLQEVL